MELLSVEIEIDEAHGLHGVGSLVDDVPATHLLGVVVQRLNILLKLLEVLSHLAHDDEVIFPHLLQVVVYISINPAECELFFVVLSVICPKLAIKERVLHVIDSI